MTQSILAVDGVRKTFPNGVVALEDFTLKVEEGETLTLLGPSGCGKSTALRLIAGLLRPTSGDIVWSDESYRRNIGFVFQEPTLMPWASAVENVALPLRLAGVDAREAIERARHALWNVRLRGFESATPRELSGGMKMRCAIARALVTEPKLLLMDEPFAALDEASRFVLNDDLLELKRTFETTIIFVTHSIFEGVYLSTRLRVLAKGGVRVDEFTIDPALVRDEEFRLSPQFSSLARRASTALRAALGEDRI